MLHYPKKVILTGCDQFYLFSGLYILKFAMLPGYQKHQRTLKHEVHCVGIGLHSGKDTKMTLKPAPANTGIVFIRTDITDKHNRIKALYNNVSSTALCTTVSNHIDVSVATIEHLMAALWGCAIDNCLIEINGPEIPIMDGSSEPFVFLIECAGAVEQKQPRKIIEVLKSVDIEENGCRAAIHPADAFGISFEIDFNNHKVVRNQKSHFDAESLSFKNDLCRARTFGFEHEVDKLREMGLALGGSLDNAIVVGKNKVLNEGGLRYEDEFVRHKILDCIGDVFLAGGYLKGHLEGFKSGHGLNNKLLHKFFEDKDAYRIIQLADQLPPPDANA